MNKIFALAAVVLSSVATAAMAAETTCTAAPSCADLGYSQSSTACSGQYLKCPFDTTKVMCVNGGPHIGDLKYSIYSSNHDGWIKCDGTQYSQTAYSKLYSLLGTKFCHKYTSRTDVAYTTNNCKSGYFAVPDYRGFFLRALNSYVTASSTVGGTSSYFSEALKYKGFSSSGTAFTTPWVPQYEQLPNIKGSMSYILVNNNGSASGAFSSAVDVTVGIQGEGGSGMPRTLSFDASNSNTIYDGSHIMPASYGAYVFIYAGQ